MRLRSEWTSRKALLPTIRPRRPDASFNGRCEHSPYLGGYIEFYFGGMLYLARMAHFKPLSAQENEVAAMVARGVDSPTDTLHALRPTNHFGDACG